MKRIVGGLMAVILTTGSPAFAGEPVVLRTCLQKQAVEFSLPCFKEDPDINGKEFSTATLIEFPFFSEELKAGFRAPETWRKVDAETMPDINIPDSLHAAWVLSTFYARTDKYLKASAEMSYAPAFELYMDGAKILSQTEQADTSQPKAKKASLVLEPGYHVFVVKALYDTKTRQGGRLDFSLKAEDTTREYNLTLGADVKEHYGLMNYVNAPVVYNPQISWKGDYVALKVNLPDPEAKKFKSSTRLYKVSDLVSTSEEAAPCAEFAYSGFSDLQFAPRTQQYAYMRRDGGYNCIYVGELGGEPACLLYRTKDDLNGYTWEPQGRFMILTFSQDAEKSKNGLKRLYNPMDQWPYYRSSTSLAKLDLESGILTPLTYGYKSAQLMDISADGKKLLFSTSSAVDTIRQYDLQTVYCMNLESGETNTLFTTYFGCNASFSPKADKLLVTGSEQIFNDPFTPGVGVPCEGCFIPNDYDNDAFIYDIATGETVNITEGFGPSIQHGGWETSGAYIYFLVEEGDGNNLYAYRLSDKSWNRIPVECEVINGFDVCENGLVYAGSSIDKPYRAYYVKGNAAKADFTSGKTAHKMVTNPQGGELSHVVIGAHQAWSFKNAEGTDIEAVYYLPPDFDASRQYPCIVYYYGGTTPTPRALSMRYPKSVWASQGYVVLVLQPSGATGYSREFSAAHVNNWGKTVADEIISGVRQFCASHTFVDSTRLGCIGASYGGFMTQLLVTRTDLFAAAISHAGISSISSYWGEGYWGYLYGSAANAFSFPWNRRDIFVDQSPLFNADKVHTPLLLLHGTSDTNVPIGESLQMFKALRLLGRDVAMVTVEGENHGIVDYAKRIDWEKTILAWFEKHLKGDATWWTTLYPDKKF